jgi:hypothetical protein
MARFPPDVEDGRMDLVAEADRLGYRNPGPQRVTGMTIIDGTGNYETGGLLTSTRTAKAGNLASAELRAVKWWDVKAGKWTQHTIATDTCNLGAGVGDLNGDGRPDIIRPNAWYQAPTDVNSGSWIKHPISIGALDDRPFGEPVMAFPHRTAAGPDWLGRNEKGAHGHTSKIFTYDVNKDGRRDILTSSAHRVGVSAGSNGLMAHLNSMSLTHNGRAHALGFTISAATESI